MPHLEYSIPNAKYYKLLQITPQMTPTDSNLVKLGDWRFVLSVTSLIIYALLTRHFLRSSGQFGIEIPEY